MRRVILLTDFQHRFLNNYSTALPGLHIMDFRSMIHRNAGSTTATGTQTFTIRQMYIQAYALLPGFSKGNFYFLYP